MFWAILPDTVEQGESHTGRSLKRGARVEDTRRQDGAGRGTL